MVTLKWFYAVEFSVIAWNDFISGSHLYRIYICGSVAIVLFGGNAT